DQRRERGLQHELDGERIDHLDVVERCQFGLAERAGESQVPLQREFCGLRIERLAVLEFHVRPELDGNCLAVGGGVVGERKLRHDVEVLVDIEQLVAEGSEHDAPDIGPRERRIEDVGIFGKPDTERGFGERARRGNEQHGGDRRQTQDLHHICPLKSRYKAVDGPVIATPPSAGPSSERLKAATSFSSAGENPPSEGTMPRAGGNSAVRWQAVAWASSSAISFGTSTRQRSIAKGQRVWKRQPSGGCSALGISPCRIMRSRFASGFATGIADRSARL